MYTFRPAHIGKPIKIAGTATPAIKAIPTGAPINVPFFLNNYKLIKIINHEFTKTFI